MYFRLEYIASSSSSPSALQPLASSGFLNTSVTSHTAIKSKESVFSLCHHCQGQSCSLESPEAGRHHHTTSRNMYMVCDDILLIHPMQLSSSHFLNFNYINFMVLHEVLSRVNGIGKFARSLSLHNILSTSCAPDLEMVKSQLRPLPWTFHRASDFSLLSDSFLSPRALHTARSYHTPQFLSPFLQFCAEEMPFVFPLFCIV